MGLEYELHKWPFEQQKQMISRFTKETQAGTFPLHTAMVWPHAGCIAVRTRQGPI